MKLALAQIDMRLGDIEGICGRIEDQARLAHERGARVLCVPAPLFMGAMPGGLVGAADFEHDMPRRVLCCRTLCVLIGCRLSAGRQTSR